MMAEFADRPAGQQAIQVTEATTLVFASFWPRAGRDPTCVPFGEPVAVLPIDTGFLV